MMFGLANVHRNITCTKWLLSIPEIVIEKPAQTVLEDVINYISKAYRWVTILSFCNCGCHTNLLIFLVQYATIESDASAKQAINLTGKMTIFPQQLKKNQC